MSIEPDPYRVLGLDRTASGDEIRRAYRRLAKENHPDSAGEKALPRFLAIQAAYELLTGGPATRRGGGRTAATRPTPRDAWRADPDRARTTRDNSRRPGRPGWAPGPGSGPASSPGSSPGSRPEAGPGGAASTGTPGTTGATSSSGGPRTRSRPAGAAGATGAGSARASGTAAGRGGDNTGTSKGAAGERPRREGRKRASNKATLGSTSYDAADDEPFEPEWSGGTWYGASSGTYWTLNPKEYADPRKHGPEYQARARRRSAASSSAGDVASGAAGSGPAAGSESAAANGATADGWHESDPGEPIEPTFSDTVSDTPPSPTEAATRGAAGRQREVGRAPRTPRPPRAQHAAQPTSAWDEASGPDAMPGHSDGLDPFTAAAHVAMNLAGTPRGFMARLGLALIGWPAIGLALTTVGGELTGCGRFAASCIDLFGVGTWIAQLVIIVILLALPSVAALSAVGSLVALAASVPTAVILSASGGSREPATSATILGVVLVIAYATGVVVALVRRRYLARLP